MLFYISSSRRERPIRELMGIGADTPLRLTIKGRKLTVEPMTEEQREKKFEESLSETNRTYAKDLKALAE